MPVSVPPESSGNLCEETILVVDDAQENRTLLRHMLRAAGYTIREAADGCRAISAMETDPPPDLVLLDVMMPNMDGFQTHQEILKRPAWSDIPVIFLTALGDNENKMRAFHHGAVDYLTKPIYKPELLARIRIHLRFRQSYRALVQEHLRQLRSLREAQSVLLPAPSDVPEAAFAVSFQQLQEAGGDFYDVFTSGADTCDYIVADISGHDLGSALPTAALKALLRQNASLHYEPAESLQLLNRHLRPIFAPGQYATITYLRLNRRNAKAELACAGHVPALLQDTRKPAVPLEELTAKGDPLGCFENFSPGICRFSMTTGQRLFLFSDGYLESYRGSPVDRSTGLNHLRKAISDTSAAPLTEAVNRIAKVIHPEETDCHDDLLLLAVDAP